MNDLLGTKAMRNFMDRLSNATNVSQWIDLPQIAVFGDTSSGKSSLLSNLARIELPSNHSLTTRCPIKLQLRHADQREARVAVQWKSFNPSSNNTEIEMPPVFEERVATEETWTSIPQFVQEAQEHILEHTGKDVAPDIISLQVSGPGVTRSKNNDSEQPLTLIDLPGLAAARGQDESENLVADIQQLLAEYLQNPRCIILAVLPANVDYHNSQIMAMAQLVDPEGKRTLPVITKPDLIDVGAEQDVLDLLLGHKLSMDNIRGDNGIDNTKQASFHMIKGRGQAALDRNDSVQDGLEDETKFFSTVEPWKSVQDRTLFGTDALREKLGTIMIQQIKETLPSIIKEISEKQEAAKNELESMGHQALLTAADRRQYYQSLCTSYTNQLNSSLSGRKHVITKHHNKHSSNVSKKTTSAAAQIHEACAVFSEQIRSGSLGTVKSVVEGARVVVTSVKGDVKGEVVHLGSDFACVDYIDEDDDNIEVLFEYRGYTAQENLEVDDVWSDGSQIFVARERNVFDSLRKIKLELVRTDPSWLTDKIVENRTDDLACFLNVDIFRNIVEEFVDCDWKPHCQALVENTREIIIATVNESIGLTFPVTSHRYPALRHHLDQLSKTVAERLIQDTQKQVYKHLETEKHPYTQDQVLFDNITEARNRGLKRELETALKFDQPKQAVYDTEALKSIIDGVWERNRKKTVQEQLAEEMEIVLEAYGQVATKRVIDRTPMVCWECVRSLTSSIQESLWSVTDETLEGAMQESSGFATRYQAVTGELDEMNKSLEILESIL